MLNILWKLREQNVISTADYYFAQFIHNKSLQHVNTAAQQDFVLLVAAQCHHAYLQGDTCIRLSEKLWRNPFDLAERYSDELRAIWVEIQEKFAGLTLAQGQSFLLAHIAFTDQPGQKETPFVVQGNGIYLYRAWQDEQTVVNYLKSAVKKASFSVPTEKAKAILERYFPQHKKRNSEPDWQKIAVATALVQPFTLIAGGPGTGKTYTVARLLAALQELQLEQNLPPLRIRLAAPTGKASARLKESIQDSLAQMNLAEKVRQTMVTQSDTLHRVLGVKPFEDAVTYHEKNPLPLDLLIVDEASMIDLSLMAKLLRALPKQARLILLGDKDQLAAVEAGAILSELSRFLEQDYPPDFAEKLALMTGEQVPVSKQASAMRQYFVELTLSTRFDDNSPVGRVAKAINNMQGAESWKILSNEIPLVEYAPTASDELSYRQHYLQKIWQSAVEHYAKYLVEIPNTAPTEQQLHKIFTAFKSVRYLAALRAGDFGVESLNEKIAEALRAKGYVQFKHSRDWFVGKPIMVTQNDVNVGLLNGDVGLYLGNRVYFEDEQRGYKSFSISRIPAHEMSFVMTIHKSQGSEFGLTVVVLPPEPSPILTKELLYTAVTRSKPNLMVFARQSIWESAVRNPIQRMSGIFTGLSE